MIDVQDREIIEALQSGLPLVPAPYAAVAEKLGLDEDALLYRLAELKSRMVLSAASPPLRTTTSWG